VNLDAIAYIAAPPRSTQAQDANAAFSIVFAVQHTSVIVSQDEADDFLNELERRGVKVAKLRRRIEAPAAMPRGGTRSLIG